MNIGLKNKEESAGKASFGIKKAIALLLAGAMSISLISMAAVAEEEEQMAGGASAAEPDYLRDSSGKRIGVKSVKIDGTTYFDMNGGVKKEYPSAQSMYSQALRSSHDSGTPLGYWSQLAYLIFKANPLYSTYGYGAKNDDEFDKAMGRNENDRWPDLIDDFQKTSRGARDKSNAAWVRYTGLASANSLSSVRQTMAEEVSNGIVHVSAANVLSHNNGGACLEKLNDPTSRPVLYTIVTSIDKHGGTYRYDYKSYGIAFYDFTLTPVNDDSLSFITAAEGYGSIEEAFEKGAKGVTYKYVPDQKPDVRSYTNESAAEMTENTSRDVSISETMSNSVSTTTGLKFTQSLTRTIELGLLDMFKGTLTRQFTAEELFQFERSTSNSKTHNDNITLNGSILMPPHTGVIAELSKGTTTESTDYNCPMAINYKVVIFSMAGDVYTAISPQDWSFQRHFTTTFGEMSGSAAADIKASRNGDSLANNTYGWSKSTSNPVRSLDWGTVNGKTAASKSRSVSGSSRIGSWLSENVPMSTYGGTMTNTYPTYNLKNRDLYPLYPLRETMFTFTNILNVEGAPFEVREYEIDTGNTLSLDGTLIGLKGYNGKTEQKNHILYYGFEPKFGSWVMTDKNGIPVGNTTTQGNSTVTETDYAKLTFTKSISRIVLETKKPGDVYLKYVIDDNVYRSDGQTNYTKNSELTKTATIHVQVSDPVHDGTIEVTGSVNGTLGDVIDLNSSESGVKAIVYDKSGKEILVEQSSITWEQKNRAGLTIDENNLMTLDEVGDFKIRACYMGVWSDWVDVTVKVDAKEVTVISLYVTAPVEGKTPNKIATSDEEGYTCDVAWNPNDRQFRSGVYYTANMTITAEEGYEFDDDVVITVNGETAKIVRHTATKIAISYNFDATPSLSSYAYDDSSGGYDELIVFDEYDVCLINDLMSPVFEPFGNTLVEIFDGE
ncbi:MAG: hypothetical protein FWG90_09980 [Oscillospiraceae bacterium]|nr:hypothetical protein [Oscillospiraceae bacterium]